MPFDWKPKIYDPLDRFFGQLVSTNVRAASGCEVFLYGLPFDGAVLGRKGCAKGPQALREALKLLKTGCCANDEVTRRIFDMGDVKLPTKNVLKAHALAEAKAREALALAEQSSRPHDARVIALGGDHSLAFPCAWPYLQRLGERFAVINLDAHLDVRHVVKDHPPNSGTGFGRLLDKGLVYYACVGARDFQTSPAYVKRVEDSSGMIVTSAAVHEKGALHAAREVLNAIPQRVECIYLSVDLDVADAAVAPGVSAPTPGGLFAHQLFALVRAFAADPRTRVAGVFELAPNLEAPRSDRTARLAAGCVALMLASE